MDWHTRITFEPLSRSLRGWVVALSAGVACVASVSPAWAEAGGGGLQAQVEGLLKQLPQPQAPDRSGQRLPWRVEISLGQLDPRIRLAPCDRVKAYMPSGAQLWGRTRVGLRCEQGAVRWNVYWPVQVKVWGQALVARVPLRPGTVVSASDVALAEVDLAASQAAVLTREQDIVGRSVVRAIAPGQGLRQDDIKGRRWFAAGEPVRLHVKGAGFMVAGEGVALSPGDEGRCARIRTEQGRVLCGEPVGERLVEVTL